MRPKFEIPEADINIIPLLDVLLVLVAVLLLLTPFMAKSINVDLPTSKSGAVMTQDSSITLEIKFDGTVWYQGVQINNWKEVENAMKAATAAKIFADKGASFQAVTQVLDRLGQNGVRNIQFGTKD